MIKGRGISYQFMHLGSGSILFRYAVTGALNTAVDITSFTVLIALGLSAEPANVLAFLAGCVNSYVVNRNFTFQLKHAECRGGELGRIALFAGVTLICTIIAFLTFHFIAPVSGPYQAKACSMIAVLAVGYALNKTFVFRSPAGV